MIKILAKSVIKPEKINDYLILAKELIEKSKMENGCMEYGLWQSHNDPYTLTMFETWENETAIEIHNNSTHFKNIIPQMKKMRISNEVEMYKCLEF